MRYPATMDDVLNRLEGLTERLELMADRLVCAEAQLYGVTRRAVEHGRGERRGRADRSATISHLWEQHRQREQQLSLAHEISRLQAQVNLHRKMQAKLKQPPDPASTIKLEHERNNLQLHRAHVLSRLNASNRVRQKLRERQLSRHEIDFMDIV